MLIQREYKANKKKADKTVRMEKDELQSVLFKAFEKHQFYNIKDLKDITQQPIVSCTFTFLFYTFPATL